MVIDFSMYYDLPRQIDRMFEDFLRPLPISQRRVAYPPMNILEGEEDIVVQAEIPGLGMEDIELTLTDGSLVIKGERKAPQGSYYRQERPVGPFQRIVNLNVPVERDQVKATLKNGLLEVKLPKAAAAKAKKISIES